MSQPIDANASLSAANSGASKGGDIQFGSVTAGGGFKLPPWALVVLAVVAMLALAAWASRRK